ncbi:hypothetical protein [Paenibacillus sp. FSL H3-0310]|uniref:hypothetical protein n=1 Tax=Paenibacillus sp. FSL H3-0310 TaxID=2921429 RepID=UPI0030F5A040
MAYPGSYSSVPQVQEWLGKYVDMTLVGNIQINSALISKVDPIPGTVDAGVTYIQYPYGRPPLVQQTTASAIVIIGQAMPPFVDNKNNSSHNNKQRNY